ncbi:hypothetical protein G4G27_06235 [Sphingomonas sp. So64.6b]|uniref:hypothetical protein n=1 Tax=Sphingomonas sp. So64.6b TaxID=2997354 RepID=UPI001601210C|nr:hypothetical protein [Sphingomonas sp. So64.6b]QNA83640.1 hypothetical protein G4G27_06235 [Sphingomonas sp. So64.6b]
MSSDIKKVSAKVAQATLTDAVDWKQYDGMRIVKSTASSIYLVMWGQLHWIPDPGTFNSVFRDWNGIVTSDYLTNSIPMGTALSDLSFIGISGGSPAQYLVSMNAKHLIPTPAVANAFNFHSPVKVPVLALQYIPSWRDVS